MTDQTEPNWLRLSITFATDTHLASALEDGVRMHLDGAGVETIIEEDETTMGGTDLPAGRKRLVAYLEEDESATAVDLKSGLERFGAELMGTPAASPLDIQLDAFTDTGWRDAWKAFFVPAVVSPRLGVRAPWAELKAGDGVEVLVIEPGMAFGTGLHETTRLCMAALDRLIGTHEPASMLDVGCGSGVLSIAAAKLGVARVVGIDVDPIAVTVSEENAVSNQTTGTFSTAGCDELEETFPLVVANILSHILLRLRDGLLARMAPAGRLLLCGLLIAEESQLVAAFTESGHARLVGSTHMGEWSCLELERC